MNHNLRKFSEIDFILSKYNPLTPCGRAEKERHVFYTDACALEREYDLTDKFIFFKKNKELHFAKISNHLKNIPLIDFDIAGHLNSAEIFLVKKLLYNAKAVIEILPDGIKKDIETKWILDDLYLSLKQGGGDGEIFHISDSYCPQLKKIRAEIRKKDGRIASLKRQKLAKILKTYGLDFKNRDFLVADKGQIKKISEQDLFIEPYDARSIVLKPVFGNEYFEAAADREKLSAQEKTKERDVLTKLSAHIKKHSVQINRLIADITKIDILSAKAALAVGNNLTRPKLLKFGSKIEVKNGNYLPLSAYLKNTGMKYTPLSCKFNKRLAVIRGSNMGGKTVVLKTMSFLQLCAQMGLFAPAKKFETVVFDKMAVIGGNTANTAGLSSFGEEIFSLVSEYKKNENIFLIIDEFGRTTNSVEAQALVSAIMADFDGNSNVYVLFSTHLANVGKQSNMSFYRMAGFDGAGFSADGGKASVILADKLKMINSFMNYSISEDNEKFRAYDAVNIADILGLDKKIIARALNFAKTKK